MKTYIAALLATCALSLKISAGDDSHNCPAGTNKRILGWFAHVDSSNDNVVSIDEANAILTKKFPLMDHDDIREALKSYTGVNGDGTGTTTTDVYCNGFSSYITANHDKFGLKLD